MGILRSVRRAFISTTCAMLLVVSIAAPGRAAMTTATPDFSLRVSPSSGQGTIGYQAVLTDAITTTTTWPAQRVTFSVRGLPHGATYYFSPPSVTSGGSARLYVTTAPSTPTNVYSLTIVATGWYVTRTATFDFHALCGPPWDC